MISFDQDSKNGTTLSLSYTACTRQYPCRNRFGTVWKVFAFTNLYYGLSWTSVITASLLLAIGLWNAQLAASEKGFYGMAFAPSLFAAVTVQKNVRDMASLEPEHHEQTPEN